MLSFLAITSLNMMTIAVGMTQVPSEFGIHDLGLPESCTKSADYRRAFDNFREQQIGRIRRLSPGLIRGGITAADEQTMDVEVQNASYLPQTRPRDGLAKVLSGLVPFALLSALALVGMIEIL